MELNSSVVLQKSTIGRSLEVLPIAPPGAAAVGMLVKGVDFVSKEWGARLAARLFLTPHRRPLPAREREWLGTAERLTFAVAGFRLAASSFAKEGRPVLLVHGWEGRGTQLGAFAEHLVAAGLRPIAIDLPAHGESPGKRSNLLEFAAAITGVVEELGGVAGIVAHSFGAAATTVALRRPLAVERLVYLAPSEDFDFFPRVFGQWLRLEPELPRRMQRLIERRFGIQWEELRGAVLAPGMRQPLLVVHDQEDRDVPWEHGKTYAERWPGARLLSTRGLGHRKILRDGGVIAEAVGFLRPTAPAR